MRIIVLRSMRISCECWAFIDELKEVTLDLVFLVLSLVVAARDGVHSAFIFVLLCRLYIVPASRKIRSHFNVSITISNYIVTSLSQQFEQGSPSQKDL